MGWAGCLTPQSQSRQTYGLVLVDKYNFFLDEMILRKNRMMKEKLDMFHAAPPLYPLM
jgi:hypothetical protein